MIVRTLMRMLAVGCLWVFVGWSASAVAASEPDAFTSHVADAFAAALPEATISIAGPLRLRVSIRGADGMTIYLNRMASYCARDAQGCDHAITEFVANMSASIREENAPIDKSSLMAIVRTADYVEQMRRQTASRPDSAPVVRSLAGDLWMICVIDQPHGVKILRVADLATLGLSEEEAIALAKQHLAKALPPVSTVLLPPPAAVSFGSRSGQYYDSSWLLMHDEWAPLAAAMKGSLVVAVPSNDYVIWGDTANELAVPSMAAEAAKVVAAAQRPLSATLLRWTPTGWEPLEQRGQPR